MKFLKKIESKTAPAKKLPKLSDVQRDIKALMKEIEAKVEDFSQLRYQLSDLAKAGDKKAKELYDGWTRVVHLYFSDGVDQIGQKNARWHGDEN
jgi:predicted  nucleic acid-binding Zn-ribbon protein